MMQEYVNTDYHQTLSIVGLVGDPGHGRIIAEARFIKLDEEPVGETAFVVDEKYQKMGIATFMYRMLMQHAGNRGLEGFTADVLASNTAMKRVLEKAGTMSAKLEQGTYSIKITFDDSRE